MKTGYMIAAVLSAGLLGAAPAFAQAIADTTKAAAEADKQQAQSLSHSDVTKQPAQSLSHSDVTKQPAQSLSHSDDLTKNH